MKKLILWAALLLGVTGSTAWAEVKTGAPAPDFEAVDAISGETFSLKQLAGKIVVLEWVNYECPFVKKHYSGSNMQNLQARAKKDGVVWVSINSGAKGKQGHFDSDAQAVAAIKAHGAVPAHYVRDEEGKIGRLYGAKATPHMFVIDARGQLAYQGAIDSKPSVDIGDIPTSTNYVSAALDALLAGKPIAINQTRSYGCVVKYAN